MSGCMHESVGKHSDLIYDVGMHKGEDTDFYLKKGFRVIGFEADPDLAEHCRRRFAEEIRGGRLTVVEGAIVEARLGSTGRRSVRFYRNRQVSVWGTAVHEWALRNERFGTSSEMIEVRTVDFGLCLRQYGIPHYLKVDIEGLDIVCLRALQHVDPKPDFVSIESEKVSFARLRAEFRLLRRLGYDGFKAVQQQSVPSHVEPISTREGSYVGPGHRFEAGSSGLFGLDLPGEWKSYSRILDQYRFIFLLYRAFGDDSVLRRYFWGRQALRAILRRFGRPLPGWFDTHAMHSSVVSPRGR